MCTDALTSLQNVFSMPVIAPFTPVLPPFYLKPLVHLCISDENKRLLVKSPKLTPLLTEALLLDPKVRKRPTVGPEVKPTSAFTVVLPHECMGQLASFRPI